MSPLRFFAALLALALPAFAAQSNGLPDDAHELKIGESAPDFSLPGIDGQTHTLAEYRGGKILVVAFLSNHCPSSHAIEERFIQTVSELGPRGVKFVAINPNNPDGLREDELGYSKYNDGPDDMKKYAAEQKFNFPYLYDGATQATAKAYGCLATPHVFVFDAEGKLRYQGRWDDSRLGDAATVKSPDGRNALDALLAGRPVPVPLTKPHGCSTKWMTKASAVAEDNAKWEKKPVELQTIDAAGVSKLRQNGTPKVRLINVWATWCGPCVAEFPELVKTARKFGLRDFELITISLDDPKNLEKAKAFLEAKHAALTDKLKPSLKAEGRTTNSYLYNGASQDELVQALDPMWPGPIPHTVLVAPTGEVLWRHNGPIDGEELRDQILAVMGRFYKD